MFEDGSGVTTDRRITWEVIVIALVAVIGALAVVVELAWPGRPKLADPWGQPILLAVLWSSFFVILCKRLLRKWTFWIALAAGIIAQVWAAKALIVSGVYLRRRASEGTVVLGTIVWGLVYRLLTWISVSLGSEESASGRDDNELS